MNTETNQEDGAQSQESAGEGTSEADAEVVTLKKEEFAKLNETIGSLKRDLKDLKKADKEPKDTPDKTKTDDTSLLQKSYLRSAGITDAEEVEEALKTAKKWGVEVDQLVDDDDWKVKLDKIRTSKANTLASSNVRGNGSTSQAKNTPEHWIAKGVPPTASDVPDRKTRAKIARAMMDSAKNSKKFYSD